MSLFPSPAPFWGFVMTRNLTWVMNKPPLFLLPLLFAVLRILGRFAPPLLRPHRALWDGAALQQGARSCSRLGKGVTSLVCPPTAPARHGAPEQSSLGVVIFPLLSFHCARPCVGCAAKVFVALEAERVSRGRCSARWVTASTLQPWLLLGVLLFWAL